MSYNVTQSMVMQRIFLPQPGWTRFHHTVTMVLRKAGLMSTYMQLLLGHMVGKPLDAIIPIGLRFIHFKPV